MKFEYTCVADQLIPGGFAYLPLIDINLGEKRIPVKCLIDSGSPVTIIHSPLAVITGIIPIKGKKSYLMGVGGGKITGFYRLVEFSLYGYLCKSQAFITAELNTPYAILGQIGFFQQFRIKFILEKYTFEIITSQG